MTELPRWVVVVYTLAGDRPPSALFHTVAPVPSEEHSRHTVHVGRLNNRMSEFLRRGPVEGERYRFRV